MGGGGGVPLGPFFFFQEGPLAPSYEILEATLDTDAAIQLTVKNNSINRHHIRGFQLGEGLYSALHQLLPTGRSGLSSAVALTPIALKLGSKDRLLRYSSILGLQEECP